MYFLLLILFIIAALIIVLIFKPLVISFYLDTDKMDMHALARWHPIRIEAKIINYRIFMRVFLFSKRIYARFLKSQKEKRSKTDLFRAMALSDTMIKISYGLNEPYLTGVFSGAAHFIKSLISTADIELEPEFIPENEFLRIKANTSLNIGRTLLNLLKLKFKNARRRKNYGSAEFS